MCVSVVGTVKAEITVPSVENPNLTNVLPLKSEVGQNIAIDASPTVKNFFLVLISTFLVILQILFLLFNCVNGPRNKLVHPAHSHKRFKQVPVVSAYKL